MKPAQVYGVKTVFALYLLIASFALLSGGVFLALRLLYGYSLLSFCFLFLFLFSGYLYYLAFYERNRRFEKLTSAKGKDVDARLHYPEGERKGSPHPFAECERNGVPIQGRLYGVFFSSFRKSHPEGTLIHCYLLDSGDFVLYEEKTKAALPHS